MRRPVDNTPIEDGAVSAGVLTLLLNMRFLFDMTFPFPHEFIKPRAYYAFPA